MTSPLARPDIMAPWTVDDLYALPDDGYRYEIFDGSLLVTPPPPMPHFTTLFRLRRLLDRQMPDTVAGGENMGVRGSASEFYIPDYVVFPATLLGTPIRYLDAPDVLLAIEVVSRGNANNDLVLKRHAYATAKIPEYWIIDERDRSLRVCRPDHSGGYEDRAVVRPGEQWRSDEPFPLVIDPEEIF